MVSAARVFASWFHRSLDLGATHPDPGDKLFLVIIVSAHELAELLGRFVVLRALPRLVFDRRRATFVVCAINCRRAVRSFE